MKSKAKKKAQNELWQRIRGSRWFRLEVGLIAFAITAGLGSAALSHVNQEARQEALLAQFKVQKVAVAAKDMAPGTLLNASSLQFFDVLEHGVTENMVKPSDVKNILGRRLGVELRTGDPLLLTAVEGAGLSDSFSAKIPTGKRLVTLQIADRVAAHGWIRPNDRVDIIAHLKLPDRGHTTFTMLQDITVVSVGDATVWDDGESTKAAEIGFFVDPKDVDFIAFAQQRGKFSLALRNPKDIKKDGDSRRNLGKDGVDMSKFLDHTNVRGASGGSDLPVFIQGQKNGESPKK